MYSYILLYATFVFRVVCTSILYKKNLLWYIFLKYLFTYVFIYF